MKLFDTVLRTQHRILTADNARLRYELIRLNLENVGLREELESKRREIADRNDCERSLTEWVDTLGRMSSLWKRSAKHWRYLHKITLQDYQQMDTAIDRATWDASERSLYRDLLRQARGFLAEAKVKSYDRHGVEVLCDRITDVLNRD